MYLPQVRALKVQLRDALDALDALKVLTVKPYVIPANIFTSNYDVSTGHPAIYTADPALSFRVELCIVVMTHFSVKTQKLVLYLSIHHSHLPSFLPTPFPSYLPSYLPPLPPLPPLPALLLTQVVPDLEDPVLTSRTEGGGEAPAVGDKEERNSNQIPGSAEATHINLFMWLRIMLQLLQGKEREGR